MINIKQLYREDLTDTLTYESSFSPYNWYSFILLLIGHAFALIILFSFNVFLFKFFNLLLILDLTLRYFVLVYLIHDTTINKFTSSLIFAIFSLLITKLIAALGIMFHFNEGIYSIYYIVKDSTREVPFFLSKLFSISDSIVLFVYFFSLLFFIKLFLPKIRNLLFLFLVSFLLSQIINDLVRIILSIINYNFLSWPSISNYLLSIILSVFLFAGVFLYRRSKKFILFRKHEVDKNYKAKNILGLYSFCFIVLCFSLYSTSIFQYILTAQVSRVYSVDHMPITYIVFLGSLLTSAIIFAILSLILGIRGLILKDKRNLLAIIGIIFSSIFIICNILFGLIGATKF